MAQVVMLLVVFEKCPFRMSTGTPNYHDKLSLYSSGPPRKINLLLLKLAHDRVVLKPFSFLTLCHPVVDATSAAPLNSHRCALTVAASPIDTNTSHCLRGMR
jgi:hypothetical protein